MKKYKRLFILSLIASFTLALPLAALAGTAGNTAGVDTLHGRGVFSLKETNNISFETTFDTDYIFARDLKAGDVTNPKLEDSEWYMFKFGYKLFDRIEPYIRLGGAHLKAKWTDNVTGTGVAMDTRSGFAWGLGLKALIYEFKNPKIQIIGDTSFRQADLTAYKGYLDQVGSVADKRASRFLIREWQLSLLAASEIDLGSVTSMNALKGYKLDPYGGVKFSDIGGRLRLNASGTGNIYHPDNIKSDKTVGIVTGLDLVAPGDYLSFNLEGRFIDELALSGGLSLLF